MSNKNTFSKQTFNLQTLSLICGSTLFGIASCLAYPHIKKILFPNNFKIKNKSPYLPSNIDKYFTIALQASLSAGNLVKQYINDNKSKLNGIKTKSSTADLVTLIDKKSEKLILNYIKNNFPNDNIIAEESNDGTNIYNIDNNKVTWCIDPIDGTTNFFYGLPITCICIGIRYKGKSVMGIVHCPILNETYFGIHSNGSYVFKNNDISNRIKLNTNNFDNINNIRDILILTEVGYDRTELISNSFGNRMSKVLGIEKVRGVRCLGSCAINMCFVASGKAEIFYEGIDKNQGPKPWDFTAPEIIVNEAGGYICRTNGDEFDITKGNIICACNKLLADYFVEKKYALAK